MRMLSPREREVLKLAAAGLSVIEIAAQLHVSTSTVKSHKEMAFSKLDSANIVHAVVIAIDRGILTTSEILEKATL